MNTMNGSWLGRARRLPAGRRTTLLGLLLACMLTALTILSPAAGTAAAKSGSWPIAPPPSETTVFSLSLAGQTYQYTWADMTGTGVLGATVTQSYTLESQEWTGIWLRKVLADVQSRSGMTLRDDWKLKVVAGDGYASGMMFVGDVRDPYNNYLLATDPVQGCALEEPTEADWNDRADHPELWFAPTYLRICTNGDYGNTAFPARLVKTTDSMTVLDANGNELGAQATASLSLTSPTVSQTKAYRVKGTKLALRATATKAAGAAAAEPVVWKTGNAKVASVAANGTVTARAAGTAAITAKSGAFTRRFTVVVVSRPRAATKITLPATRTMAVGATARAGARLYPATATVTVTWKSGNTAIVKVDRGGNLKAVKKGKATITVRTSNGRSAKCVVTVR